MTANHMNQDAQAIPTLPMADPVIDALTPPDRPTAEFQHHHGALRHGGMPGGEGVLSPLGRRTRRGTKVAALSRFEPER
jgi:hypothetical protein